MLELSLQALVKVTARAMFQGNELLVTMFVVGPNMVTPAYWDLRA